MFHFRPHHVMCTHFYRGAGYSPEFVSNLSQIIACLQNNPDESLITIVNGVDSICECCPSCDNLSCQDQDKVMPLDQSWQDFFGFKEGDLFSWRQLCELVKSRMKLDSRLRGNDTSRLRGNDTSRFRGNDKHLPSGYDCFVRICKNCQWFTYCEPLAKLELT